VKPIRKIANILSYPIWRILFPEPLPILRNERDEVLQKWIRESAITRIAWRHWQTYAALLLGLPGIFIVQFIFRLPEARRFLPIRDNPHFAAYLSQQAPNHAASPESAPVPEPRPCP
jgi:hypothetical protein